MEFIILTRWPLTNADIRYLERMVEGRWPGAKVTVSPVRENPTTGPSEVKGLNYPLADQGPEWYNVG